ncbi:Ubiquitin carboxyl-terminal hydrolase, variant 2 [Balamuthia mandrillaris]
MPLLLFFLFSFVIAFFSLLFFFFSFFFHTTRAGNHDTIITPPERHQNESALSSTWEPFETIPPTDLVVYNALTGTFEVIKKVAEKGSSEEEPEEQEEAERNEQAKPGDGAQEDGETGGASAVISLIGDSATNRKLEQRRLALNELLHSEHSYVECLETLVKKFYEPLSQQAERLHVEPHQITAIFSNVKVLWGLHKTILRRFDKEFNKDNTSPNFAKVLVGMAPFLKVYTQYVVDGGKSTEVLRQCQQHKAFRVWLAETEDRSPLPRVPISNLLIRPIRHIPNYALLLARVLNYTPTTHPQHAPFEQALQLIKELAGRMNHHKDQADNRLKVIETQQKLQVNGLAKPHRRFIREGPLWLISERQARSCYVYLFDDLILVSKHSKDKDNRDGSNRLSAIVWLTRKNARVYNILDDPTTSEYRHAFRVRAGYVASRFSQPGPKNYIFLAATPAEKHSWMTDIQTAIRLCREKEAQRASLEMARSRELEKQGMDEFTLLSAERAKAISPPKSPSGDDRRVSGEIQRENDKKEGYEEDPLESVLAHDMAGWLVRPGRLTWKKRWCVLEDGVLYFYKTKPKGPTAIPTQSLQLCNYYLKRVSSSRSSSTGTPKHHHYNGHHHQQQPHQRHGFVLYNANEADRYFEAPNKEELKRWLASMLPHLRFNSQRNRNKKQQEENEAGEGGGTSEDHTRLPFGYIDAAERRERAALSSSFLMPQQQVVDISMPDAASFKKVTNVEEMNLAAERAGLTYHRKGQSRSPRGD